MAPSFGPARDTRVLRRRSSDGPSGYWARQLGLDANQEASVKTILADHRPATSALMTNLEQRERLTSAAEANGADAEMTIIELTRFMHRQWPFRPRHIRIPQRAERRIQSRN